ncbi:MAG TPA: serine/threonine-protein kinase [Pirellulaceae bacterium]|nr:serine/threonine-protein kinase [Pirellulaceae bacterium]
MSSPSSSSIQRSTFRHLALLSGLVTQQQIDAALHELRLPPNAEFDDKTLANKLVEQNVLTPYQAEQIGSGRTKFRLKDYIITDSIGSGGMGQVFKAVHQMMGRECAVKVLPITKSTPEAIVSFAREIRTQAKLDHPNLVRANDAGHDGAVHFLVTEYVPGTDLRRLVRSQGALNMQQAASVIRQAALALQYAHERGLIHRDVKPGNILVTPDGVAKLSDLGLAGFLHEADSDPRAGKIVGTADYLAPEQIRNPLEVTSVADIYSLGCTLYYAITGKVPFPGGTAGSKARRHLEGTPLHPRQFNQEISEEFVDVIADMMEKDPAVRVQSAADVATRLEPWAHDARLVQAQQMTRSPWSSAPLPTVSEDDRAQGITVIDDDDTDSSQADSPSQISQGTLSVASQETRRLKPPKKRREKSPTPAVELPDGDYSTSSIVVMTLAIAVPLSMLTGAAIAIVLLKVVG